MYVGEGTLDVGITGRDLLLDSGAKAEESLQLGFGRSTFRFAARPGRGHHAPTTWPASASPRRTTGWCSGYLQERGIEATVIRLDGAVETSVQLGVADVIADVVETGSTLRQAGLEIVGDVIMESEAVLISRVDAAEHPGLEVFLRRLQGVLVARSYVMMDYDIPRPASRRRSR